jgi:hypothetical protein
MRVLDEKGSLPPGMVRVAGAETSVGQLDDFFIDKYEVTNKEYKEFVDGGGTTSPPWLIFITEILAWLDRYLGPVE